VAVAVVVEFAVVGNFGTSDFAFDFDNYIELNYFLVETPESVFHPLERKNYNMYFYYNYSSADRPVVAQNNLHYWSY